ncbi:MAG: hypothetical protein CMH50_03295 [Myxococcales bacterium]|nr:hypothetical protein [Myxococcales bacterium]
MRLLLFLSLIGGLTACFGHRERDQRLGEIHRGLGVDFMSKRDWRRALGELRTAKKYDPKNAEVRYSLAFCQFYGFQQASAAEQELRKAIGLKTDYSEAYNLLGIVLNHVGRRDEAIEAFETALNNMLYRTPFFAAQNLAPTLVLMGREKEGMKRLRLALKGNPNLCGAYLSLLDLAQRRRDKKTVKRYDPEFLSRCVQNPGAGERLPNEVRREAYLRGIKRARAKKDRDRAQQLIMECRKRVPRRDDERGPGCPKAAPDGAFGGDAFP